MHLHNYSVISIFTSLFMAVLFVNEVALLLISVAMQVTGHIIDFIKLPILVITQPLPLLFLHLNK